MSLGPRIRFLLLLPFLRKRLPHPSRPVIHAAVAVDHTVHPEPTQDDARGGQGNEHSEFHFASYAANLRRKRLMSSRIMYSEGTIPRVMNVAKTMPKPRDRAMGMRKRA